MAPSHHPTRGHPFVSIVPPSRQTIEQLNERYSVNAAGYGSGFDAITDGRYFFSVLQTLRRLQQQQSIVPMGPSIDRRDIGQPSRPIVPEMVSGPSIVPKVNLPQKVITRTPASRTEKLPENRPIPAIPQLLPERKETTMDLGNLVKDLATTYISTRYGQPQQPRPIMAQPVGLPAVIGGGLSRLPSLGGITGGVLGGAMGDLMGGFENFGGAMQGCNNPADVVFRWSPAVQDYVPQKRRKRRRKQLVTQSDIKGLAALKGVVGTGKIMETWIATHA